MPTDANAERIRHTTLCLVNHERTRRGRHALRRNRTLEAVATHYSRRMAHERFFDHVSPDGSTLTRRIGATGYLEGAWKRWSIGENLAWGTGELATPASIVRGWMHSPGHRHNILNGSFREAGMGVLDALPNPSITGHGTVYTNVFGERVQR